jgi:phage shock protein PspC (stress-responsive transcriptional regulator)
MNTSTPDNNGYQPPSNGWVPPAPQSPQNGNHGGYKFFQSIRQSGFFRSESRWIGGVAGGLARRLNVDPLVVRVVFILLGIVTTGFALLAYAAAWALLPEERDGRIHAEEAVRGNFDGALIVIGLAALMGFGSLGSFFLFAEALPGPLVGLLWFAFIAAVGYAVYAIYNESQKKTGQNPPFAPPTPGFSESGAPQQPVPGVQHPESEQSISNLSEEQQTTEFPSHNDEASSEQSAAEATEQSDSVDAADSDGSPAADTAIISVPDVSHQGGNMNDTQTIPNPDSTQPYAHGFTGGGSDNYTGTAHGDWAHDQSGWSNNQADWSGNNNWDGTRAAEWTPPTPEPAKPKGQFAIGFGLTLVLAAILLGAVHFGYLEQGSVALSLVVSIAIILGGLMVIVNGLRGRPSGGAGFFSVMALITALFFGITGVAGANFKAQNFTGISSQSLTPQSIAEIEGGFSFCVGDLVLDLTQIPLSEFAERDEPLDIEISGGVGEIRVVFPSSIKFHSESSLGAGEYTDPHQTKSSRVVGSQSYSHESSSGLTDAPEVNVNISLGLGNINISGVFDTRTIPGDEPANTLSDNEEVEVNR